jgi:hypothetical protein
MKTLDPHLTRRLLIQVLRRYGDGVVVRPSMAVAKQKCDACAATVMPATFPSGKTAFAVF